jgi:pyruvate dehydrogenase E1 component beta subunit
VLYFLKCEVTSISLKVKSNLTQTTHKKLQKKSFIVFKFLLLLSKIDIKKTIMRTIQFREAIAEAMSEEMRRDESVYLMGEEVAEYNGAYKASKGMLDEFGPKRVIDTPIAELGFAGIAVGSAMNGCRPIVEYMTFNFSLVGIDQIINNAAKMRQMSAGQFPMPMVFRGPTASAGQLGATHSQAFENWFANTPGLKVVVPSTVYDAKGLLKAAIRDNDPVIFMESEQMYGDKGEVPEGEYTIPLGVADIKREGTDVTIVSFGKIIKEAHIAADTLDKEGISCEIIDLRTVRPMDYDTILNSVKKTNRLVVLEEAWPFASVASEITYIVQERAFDFLDAPIQRITTADTPAPYSPTLLKEWLPNAEDVIKAVKKVMYKNN